MNKLTVEVARRHQRDLKSFQENPKIGLSLKEELYLQALEIALPVLEQQEKGQSDWIEWGGGERPVEADVQVEVRFRDWKIIRSEPATYWNWFWHNSPADIIAYRVIEQQERERGEEA